MNFTDENTKPSDLDPYEAKELQREAKRHAPEALQRVLEQMRTSASDTTCLKAAELVLVRAYGKNWDKALEDDVKDFDSMSASEQIAALEGAIEEIKAKQLAESVNVDYNILS